MPTNHITGRSKGARRRPPPRCGAAMPTETLTVERHDRHGRAEITLAGEIDMASAPIVRHALSRCLADGVHAIEVDLAQVGFCDCSGLSALLQAYQRATAAGVSLRLRDPRPVVARLTALACTDTPLLHLGGAGGDC
ncbi:STAS domain-containing protein [Streptacidiphilus melanogenes]|uniref:STAS domain-containing protein n=1 Tax=Streptacidiphilus melanogenes TaxID=411235 RepID=UPI001F1C83F9|nr:STAS domain-containing protein [Streptacidiphilus melanogenes]